MTLGSYGQNPNLFSDDLFYDLLDVIVDEPAPTLPAGQFSAEFEDFIANCLRKQDESRASAEELLNHPFVTMHRGKDISQWAAIVYAQQERPAATLYRCRRLMPTFVLCMRHSQLPEIPNHVHKRIFSALWQVTCSGRL